METKESGKGTNLALADLVAGIFIFLLGLVLYFWAVPYHVSASFSAMKGIGPKTFPSAFALLVAVLGIFLALKSFQEFNRHKKRPPFNGDGKSEDRVQFTWIALIVPVVGLLYSALLKPGGYLIVNTLCILILFKVFGGQKWWQGLLLGVGASICLYLFFSTYLDLAIPVGLLFED